MTEASDINVYADDYFAGLMKEEPTWAHMLGNYSDVGSFEDCSRAAEDLKIANLRSWLDRVDALETDEIDADGQTTLGVLRSDVKTRLDLAEARLAEFSADPIFGPQTTTALVMSMLGVPDEAVAEAMLGKLAGVGAFFSELGNRHLEGVEAGRAPAEFAVTGTIKQIEDALAVPVGQDPIVTSIKLPDGVDAEAWRARLAEAVQNHVRPGMEAYRDVLRREVLPVARPDDEVGLSWLPDGAATYDATLRFYTTTSLSAQEIHDIGLAQIEALGDEYRELGPRVVGTDDLAGIFEAMRTDPKLHFESAEQLVEASEVAMRRAWDAMGDWFEVLPKAPCVVEGTTTGAKAFYYPPAGDGSRGGTFFINVDQPESWGTFELESLAFHEGIPGHHLQLAIAAELPASVPKLRKYAETAAYAEGWGLYSERLADEMGLYSTDVDRMGMLSADSLRACRLVVDTGLHALGWSRRQAVDYMVANSPMTEAIIRPEVDRYIVTPGQAASYMIGRLEIQRMRREAEQRQGAAFDIKQFHSAVLDSGTLPLDVLDRVVKARLG